MARKSSEASCFQRTRKRLRRQVNNIVGEGFFGTLSRLGRLHPMAKPAKHGVQVIRDIEYLRERQSSPHPRYLSSPPTGPARFPSSSTCTAAASTCCRRTPIGSWAWRSRALATSCSTWTTGWLPKNPFPAAVSDICAALEWVSENARAHGGDLGRLVFAGESAGGNLATALTICCCYRRPEPFAQRAFATGLVPTAVAPACAPLQVSNPGRLNRKRKLPRWVNEILEGINEAYLGNLHDPAPGELDLADPLHVFERREHPDRALPAFFVPIGTRDPLLDDTRRLDRALKALGVECEARYYEGELHAFHALVWRRQATAMLARATRLLGTRAPTPTRAAPRVRRAGLDAAHRSRGFDRA